MSEMQFDPKTTVYSTSIGVVTATMIKRLRKTYLQSVGTDPKFLIFHPSIVTRRGFGFLCEVDAYLDMQIIQNPECPFDTIYLTAEKPKE